MKYRQCAILAFLVSRAGAQSRTVTGRVVDAVRGAAVTGAQVSAVPGHRTVLASSDGRFTLEVQAADSVRVRAVGYRGVTLAAPAASGSEWKIALVAAPTALPDLIAVAAPAERRSAEMVMPVTRLDRQAIDVAAPASVDQLLQQIPGLQQMASPPASTSIAIRGITDSRVLVLLDGEAMAGQLLEDRDLSRLSTVATDHIEVVKGPLSAVYGSQALGGVINIVSREPVGPLAIALDARSGSFARHEGSVTVSAGGPVAFRATGGWREQERLPGQAERDGTQHHVWDAQATVRNSWGAIGLRADVSALRERQRWAVGGGFYGFNDNRAVSAWTEATATALGAQWALRVAGQDFSHRYRQAQSPVPFEQGGAPTQEERTWRTRLTQTRAIGRAQSLEAGIEWSHRRVIAADRLEGERLSDRMAEGWLQDRISIGHWLLTAAARFTDNSRWGQALTPSIGLAYEPASTLRFRGGLARGFRGPSFKELGWRFLNPAAGYTVIGNPALVPESSWQTFAGATWAPRSGLVFDADLYRNNLRGMIEQSYIGTNAAGLLVYSPRNLSRARTQGIELGARYQAGWLTGSVGLDLLQTRNLATGGPLSLRSPRTARLRLSGRIDQRGRTWLDVTSRFTAAAPLVADDGTIEPGQQALTAWDVNLRFPLGHLLDVSAGVDNLFDHHPDQWQAATRRAFRVGFHAAITP